MVRGCFRILLSAVAIFAFVQCGVTECEVVMTDVDAQCWDDSATISYQNSNTDVQRNLSVMLHINRHFDSNDIALEITTCTPDSLRYSEKVLLPIKVEWANGVVDATDVELPYRRGANLRHKGEYKITITPKHPVKGVVAAGINFNSQK